MSKILIVDDDFGMRILLAQCAEREGHTAIQSSNGKRAFEIIQDNPDIALLITDVMMPEMGGRELVKILKGNEQYAQLPIVLISAVVGLDELSGPFGFGHLVFHRKAS